MHDFFRRITAHKIRGGDKGEKRIHQNPTGSSLLGWWREETWIQTLIAFYFLVTLIDYGQMNQLWCLVQKPLFWYCKEKAVQFQREHGVGSREKEN